MDNLHKIIIVGTFTLDQQDGLKTVAMETDGMKVLSVLFIDDYGTIESDKEATKKEIKDQLYDDMYEEDELKIKAKEAYDGKDVIKYLSKFITKRANEETQVYYYEPDDTVFNKLEKAIHDVNGRIYLFDYYDIFHDEYINEKKPIKEIMQDHGLKMENLLPGSCVSFAYYLTALIERLYSR